MTVGVLEGVLLLSPALLFTTPAFNDNEVSPSVEVPVTVNLYLNPFAILVFSILLLSVALFPLRVILELVISLLFIPISSSTQVNSTTDVSPFFIVEGSKLPNVHTGGVVSILDTATLLFTVFPALSLNHT